MYSKIMVPVDLAHESTVEKAIKVAADIGKLYEANVCIVGVSASVTFERCGWMNGVSGCFCQTVVIPQFADVLHQKHHHHWHHLWCHC